MAVFEWHPELRGRGPSFVFAHATGFHARCWDPVIRRLAPRHTLAIDQRGHGRSQNLDFESWAVFGRDLARLLEALEVRGAVGVGHSMGGHATVSAAALRPELYQSLVLIDPVILAPEYYSDAAIPGPGETETETGSAAAHPAQRRRNRFASAEAMIERFAGREPFSLFSPEALRAYCEHGLLPAEDGEGMQLACPPAFEARVYASVRSNPDIHDDVRALRVPVQIIRSMQPRTPADLMNFQYSPTWPELAGAFRHARDICRPDRTHFLPMQDPDWIAEQLQR